MTSHGFSDDATLPGLRILRLDSQNEASDTQSVLPSASPRAIKIEMTLHIEREGDQQMPARGWVGRLGQRKRIEAFGLRPLEEMTPGDIEYMAVGPGGRQTPWVAGPRLCGTRGRGLPLTGFAMRLSPSARDRFVMVYEGAFFTGGATRSVTANSAAPKSRMIRLRR